MSCSLCDTSNFEIHQIISELRGQGKGYKAVWRELSTQYRVSRDEVQAHCAHLERNIMSSIADAEDRGAEVDENWLRDRGLVIPDGVKWIAATVEERGPDGEKHWVRVKPEQNEVDEERVEIRQAQPVVFDAPRPRLTFYSPGNWQTWMINPDCQIGYWKDSDGAMHPIHDERCFSIGHQVALDLANTEGLHGWLDVGDFVDLSAFSRHNPTAIDLHVDCLNLTWERASTDFAKRRWVVGDEGEVVMLDANHTIRLRTSAAKNMPWLVGMRRAGDPIDEHPVLSVPYMTRARDYGVEWVPSWPQGYRILNSNLVATHSPAYGSKALDTARKVSSLIHASVVFGHIHRREHLAEAIHTVEHGTRTMEIWSDGCWARTDGSVPSERNTFNDKGDRMVQVNVTDKVGYLAEKWDQGFSIVHVEVGGKERFSAERVAIWDGFAQFRGQTFEADCDVEGKTLVPA